MKINLKGLSISFTIVSIAIGCLSFGFVGNNHPSVHLSRPAVDSSASGSSGNMFRSVYDSLHLETSGLSKEAYEYTIQGLAELRANGELENDSIVTICDFTKPSSEKRMYIIDLNNYRVLFKTWVAHGRNSGKEMASSFSNRESSYKSSLGFYRTGDTYIGGNGLSLRLHGLEKGINDKALERAIVLHGADYVSPSFLERKWFHGAQLWLPGGTKP